MNEGSLRACLNKPAVIPCGKRTHHTRALYCDKSDSPLFYQHVAKNILEATGQSHAILILIPIAPKRYLSVHVISWRSVINRTFSPNARGRDKKLCKAI